MTRLPVPWHTNDDLESRLERLASDLGPRAHLHVVGITVEGRSIGALTVAAPGRHPDRARPQALVLANIHGNEVIASEAALALLDRLQEGTPAVLEGADVTVVPAINLDSREAAARALKEDRRGAPTRRGNAHGVDLNRNFPLVQGARDVWHPLAGTRHRWLPWYRGPAPASEPETRAILDLVQDLRPRAALSLHSAGARFLYPFACSSRPPARLASFLAMGAAFTALQARPYQVQMSRSWYAILGDCDDWMLDHVGTLAVTVELGRLYGGVTRPGLLASQLAFLNPPTPGPVLEEAVDPCLAALDAGIRQGPAHP